MLRYSSGVTAAAAAVAASWITSSGWAQVDVTLTTSFDDRLEGHYTYGGEQLTVGGFSRHGDDYLMVTLAVPQGAECPSPNPVVIHRRDADLTSPWVMEASLDPLGDGTTPEEATVALDGDTLVIGRPFYASGQPGWALVYRRNAGSWDLEAELRASDPDFWDHFGESVAIDGDTIAVGAWNEGSQSNPGSPKAGPGAVYIYTRDGGTWTQWEKFTAPDGEDGDEFGRTLAVAMTYEGPSVLVGAPGDRDVDSGDMWGAGYLYHKYPGAPWHLSTKITRPPHEGFGRLGNAVALTHDYAILAGPRRIETWDRNVLNEDWQLIWDATIELDDNVLFPYIHVHAGKLLIGLPDASDAGEVQLWREELFSGWVRQPLGWSPTYEPGDRVGATVFMQDDTIVISAPLDDTIGIDSGAVHTLASEGGGYPYESVFLAAAGQPGGRFGTAAAIDADLAIIGAPEAAPCVGPGGAAFIYRWSAGSWVREDNLMLDGLAPQARFGAAVDISGGVAIVGAPDDGPSGAGAAYLFESVGGDWVLVQRIEAAQGEPGDQFGAAVALAPGRAAIGAPGADLVLLVEETPSGWTASHEVSGAAALGDGCRLGWALQFHDAGVLAGAPGFGEEDGAVAVIDDSNGAIQTVYAGWGPGHRFGSAVAANAEAMLVASPGAGRLDVYAPPGSGLNDHAVITPDDASRGDAFGASLALDGSIAVVGATDGDRGVLHAYYLVDGAWTEFTRLEHPLGRTGAGFGTVLALGDERLIAGAPLETVLEAEEGAAHPMLLDFRFTVPACPGAFTPDEIGALRPAWLQEGDVFGWSVDVEGDLAAVGAPYADLITPDAVRGNAGSVTMYRRNGLFDWTVEGVLTPDPNDPISASDTMGWDVAIDGDFALLCAPGAEGNTVNDGAALVYWFDGYEWVLLDTLTGDPALAPFTQFAQSGDMDAGRIVAGCRLADAPSGVDKAGVAWVYEAASWGEWEIVATLEADAPASVDYFGAAVAVSGDWIVVGAPERDDMGSGSGAAYVYRRDASGAWTFHDKLLAPDGDQLDRLGGAVAIEGDLIVAGARYADGVEPYAGAAYVYRHQPGLDAWTFETKLESMHGRSSDHMGASVAISGGAIACGATYGYHPATQDRTGTVFLFSYDERTGDWVERSTAAPGVANFGDAFGFSVAIDGGNLWVGAKDVDLDPANPPGPYANSGQATTFDLQCAPPPTPPLLPAFLQGYANADPQADIAPPWGVIDSADLNAFLAGLP